MNTEAARQFCHGAFLAQRCQRHLRLELCRMLLPDLRHPVTPSPAAILGAGVSLSHLSSFRGPAQKALAPPVLGWHQLGWTNRERSNGRDSYSSACSDLLRGGRWRLKDLDAGAGENENDNDPTFLTAR